MTTNPFTREQRYIVVKKDDAIKYLNDEEQGLLHALTRKCDLNRLASGKPPLQCVVVESDWPEYEPTWDAIKARVSKP